MKYPKAEAAHAMVSALCKPRYTEGHRDWVMSIPARPEYDPDLVIAAGLRELEERIALLEETLAGNQSSNEARN